MKQIDVPITFEETMREMLEVAREHKPDLVGRINTLVYLAATTGFKIHAVKSSWIRCIMFDGRVGSERLRLVKTDGDILEYTAPLTSFVPRLSEQVVNALLAHDSIGQAFNDQIRGKYVERTIKGVPLQI